MQLEKNIGQLLYCHDCVIVPEFGGFVANYRSAWVDELRQKVHPPSKELGFNSNLKRNDGLLVDHVAQEHQISFNEAGELIAERVVVWNDTLQKGERLELSGIGGMYFDQDRNLHFDPDPRTNYLTSSFGMHAVQLPLIQELPKPITKEPIGPVVIPIIRSNEQGEEEGKVNMIPAMAAVIVVLIAFGFWLNSRTSVIENGMAELSGLDPFGSTPVTTYTEGSFDLFEMEDFEYIDFHRDEDETYFTYSFTEHEDQPNGRVVAWNIPEPAVPVHTAVATPSMEERYHVVGGCFSEEQNALGLMEQLRRDGYDPKLVDKHRGLHRVAVGSYISKQQALRALAAVRKEHTPSAWLLVK